MEKQSELIKLPMENQDLAIIFQQSLIKAIFTVIRNKRKEPIREIEASKI